MISIYLIVTVAVVTALTYQCVYYLLHEGNKQPVAVKRDDSACGENRRNRR